MPLGSCASQTRGPLRACALLVTVLVSNCLSRPVFHRVEVRKVDPLRCFFSGEEKRRAKEAEIEAKKAAAEEKEKEKQRQKRQKEQEEARRQKQKHEEEEEKRKLKELASIEAEAVKRAAQAARRPLNSFEERRVRRQARSEYSGGVHLGQQDDWSKPLKPEVKDQLDDAVRFFSQTMFTPAALIGSAALGLLFLQPAKFAFCNPRDQPYSIFQFLYRVYVILAASTICLELTTVLETSNAHVQLLELGRHGRLALEPTAMDLIMANMEFEYLVCSLSFFGGLVCFISATLCRVIVAFGYDHSGRFFPQEPELCLAVSGMMLSSLLSWLHLVNVRVTEFRNFGSMICRFFILLLARFRNGEVGIIGYAAVISSLASVAGVGKILLNEYLQIREGSKAGEDGPGLHGIFKLT